MTAISYPYNLIDGLSGFWTSFFKDSPTLEGMYDGMSYLAGQAYVDLLENVLGKVLVDCPLFSRQYWKLVTIREDQVRLAAGVVSNRYVFSMPDDIVELRSLDNLILDPTASLETGIHFDYTRDEIRFLADPTNPDGLGDPTPGFARRKRSVKVGGSASITNPNWDVAKGDTFRILDVNGQNQRKSSDHLIVLARGNTIYLDASTPVTAKTQVSYVVLRRPPEPRVSDEPFITNNLPNEAPIQLANTRIVQGTVKVSGRRFIDGLDVVEGEDYVVDYEIGNIRRLTTWQSNNNVVSYEWMFEVLTGNGGSTFTTATADVNELAFWVPDVRVDRRVLAANFGTLVGKEADSSEAYREFLRGICQLYMLGPVLERFESALNVTLGLPVIRDEGEVITAITPVPPDFVEVTTARPGGVSATYRFFSQIPLRQDLYVGQVLSAFEVLTTAAQVTDYVEDPSWWHRIVIPENLFSPTPTHGVPSSDRRTVRPLFVPHVTNPEDGALTGDPGLYTGADDEGNVIAPGQPILRRTFAFVMMDRYLKAHMFYVRVSGEVFVPRPGVGAFTYDPLELQRLVFSAKPAHTYIYVEPSTWLRDFYTAYDDGWYQPNRYAGADTDAPEVYGTEAEIPDQGQPYNQLGLFFGPTNQENLEVVAADNSLTTGVNGWFTGDYFHYALSTTNNVDVSNSPTTIIPAAPNNRRLRAVRVVTTGTVNTMPVVEGTDYTVDYVAGTLTRLTVWDSNVVTVKVVYLDIGNTSTAQIVLSQDIEIVTGGTDAANVSYVPLASPGNYLSSVERALVVTVS